MAGYKVTTDDNFYGKIVYWDSNRGPSPDEILEAAKNEFPEMPSKELEVSFGIIKGETVGPQVVMHRNFNLLMKAIEEENLKSKLKRKSVIL